MVTELDSPESIEGSKCQIPNNFWSLSQSKCQIIFFTLLCALCSTSINSVHRYVVQNLESQIINPKFYSVGRISLIFSCNVSLLFHLLDSIVNTTSNGIPEAVSSALSTRLNPIPSRTKSEGG